MISKASRGSLLLFLMLPILLILLLGCEPLTIYYTLTMDIEGHGSIIPVKGDHLFVFNSLVNLRAYPDEGWRFKHWIGDVTASENPETTIVMNNHKEVVAVFEKIPATSYSLMVEQQGQGEVEVSPETENNDYPVGTVVNLRAYPDEGWFFKYWIGDVEDSESSETTIVMDRDQRVVAVFSPQIQTVMADNGSIEVLFNHHLLEEPTLKEFTAKYTFSSIEKRVFTQLSIPSDPRDFHLRVLTDSEDLILTGLEWDESSTVLFFFEPFDPQARAILYLISVSYVGGEFVDAKPFVVDALEETRYTLTIEVEGEGTTVPQKGQHYYGKDTVVELEATPAEGWYFSHWTGEVDDKTLPITTVTMDKDKTISAVFEETTTVLQPGGLLKGIDGVTIGAPEGVIDKEIHILIDRVEDPRREVAFPRYMDDVKVLGDFYAISSTEEVVTEDVYYLLLGLPVPEGVSTDHLAVVALSPPGMIITDRPEDVESLRWNLLCGALDEKTGLFGILLPYIDEEEQIFTLVEYESCAAIEIEDHRVLDYREASLITIDGFRIVCVGFSAGECTAAHRQTTENALVEAYEAYVDTLGFQKPRLRHVLAGVSFTFPFFTILGEYEYQLKKGSPNGWYNAGNRTAGTTYQGHPTGEPNPFTAHHELFHALQFSYRAFFNNRSQCVFGVVEGTAVAAELSLTELTRSTRPMTSRTPRAVDISLFQNTAPNSANTHDYQTQDFWLYVGLRINAINPQINYLIPLFRQGGLMSDIHRFLQDEGTFASLSDAYWQWVKNQTFEKTVSIGFDQHGNSVPHGDPGTWSGHGSLHNINYSPTSWESANTGFFDLTPLTSKVYRINFQPIDGDYSTMVRVSPKPNLKWKIYEVDEATGRIRWATESDQQKEGHMFQIGTNGGTGYVLISNTNSGNSINGIQVTFTAPTRTNEVFNINLSPKSPATLLVNENVDLSFEYETFTREGVRIWVLPFTMGAPTPGYLASPSPIYETGKGYGSGFFSTRIPGHVDQVRFQMWDLEQENLLYEVFVPVDYTFVHHQIYDITMLPPSPARLFVGEHVHFSLYYLTTEEDGVLIWGQPFTMGEPTLGFFISTSPVYGEGQGHAGGFFSTRIPGHVDQVRFQMWDLEQENLLYEVFVPVDYTFVGHEIYTISLQPLSPAILQVGEEVHFSFTYSTLEENGVLIWGQPFSKGELTKDQIFSSSPLYPSGQGKGSGYFTINSAAHVDEIRFQMWDSGQKNLLYEIFVPVDYTFEGTEAHGIYSIVLDPRSPATLKPGEQVSFTFDYVTTEEKGVLIFGRPYTEGELTPGYSAHGSILYPSGQGSGSGFFTINSTATVDEICFRMWDPEQEILLFEIFLPVDYTFEGTEA